MSRVSIVVPTHNRAASLRRTLASLFAQADAGAANVIVVDNNSTDGTAGVCREFGDRVRYVHEPRQGLSHARNAGIAIAPKGRDDIIVFIDDDIQAEPGWLPAITDAFDARPDIDCVGGRVLPSNPDALPAWITREHWAPLALQDHGPEQRTFNEADPRGLVGANLAFRGEVFDRIGGFSPDVQRVKDGIGSTEDHELLRRLFASGGSALYVPDAVVTTEVPADRQTRAYHRRWHRGHGRFHALMRTPEVEQARRVAGVPLHLVRRAVRDAAAWLRLRVTGDAVRAFAPETRLRFFAGFLRERCGCLIRR